jgi:DNA polymerase III delta prime subunit
MKKADFETDRKTASGILQKITLNKEYTADLMLDEILHLKISEGRKLLMMMQIVATAYSKGVVV